MGYAISEEEQITKRLVKYLEKSNWEILSCSTPQGMRARIIHDLNKRTRSKGSIIPDIIARKGNIFLLVENKPKLSKKDILKLQKLTPGHVRYIKKIYKCDSENIHVERAVGVGSFNLDDIATVPNNITVFLVEASFVRIIKDARSISKRLKPNYFN